MNQPDFDRALAQPQSVPADIAHLATRGGLGPLHRVQRSRNPFATFARSMAYAIGWLIGLCLVGLVASRSGVGPLGVLAVPFLAGAVVAAIKAIRNLLVGFTTTYLFANGVIHVKNGRATVVPWSDVDKLLLTYFAGEHVCYHLATLNGRKLRIELESSDGDPNLGLEMAHKVEQLGRPIVAVGPSSRRAHPTPPARRG
jgi:hypothetical protein